MASTSSLISAMNKSLHFKNLFENPTGSTFTIGSFENCGYYKVTLLSQTITVTIEFSQGKIISAQSVTSKDSTKSDTDKFKVKLIKNGFSIGFSVLYISDIASVNDTFSLNVEYNSGEFKLSPAVSNLELANDTETLDFKEFSFNCTEFTVSLLTSEISLSDLDVKNLTTESLYISKMHVGDWVLESDSNTGVVRLKLDPVNSNQ